MTGKLLKWIFGLVVLVLILWIAIYIIYTPSTSATNSVLKEAKKVITVRNINRVQINFIWQKLVNLKTDRNVHIKNKLIKDA